MARAVKGLDIPSCTAAVQPCVTARTLTSSLEGTSLFPVSLFLECFRFLGGDCYSCMIAADLFLQWVEDENWVRHGRGSRARRARSVRRLGKCIEISLGTNPLYSEFIKAAKVLNVILICLS